jgi:hypothetical protein
LRARGRAAVGVRCRRRALITAVDARALRHRGPRAAVRHLGAHGVRQSTCDAIHGAYIADGIACNFARSYIRATFAASATESARDTITTSVPAGGISARARAARAAPITIRGGHPARVSHQG